LHLFQDAKVEQLIRNVLSAGVVELKAAHPLKESVQVVADRFGGQGLRTKRAFKIGDCLFNETSDPKLVFPMTPEFKLAIEGMAHFVPFEAKTDLVRRLTFI
jgi:hypothetical protein